MRTGSVRPELKVLVAEASAALARLDAGRLEALAVCCEALNREVRTEHGPDRAALERESRAACGEMAILERVLEATCGNLKVMERLRDLREGRIEYRASRAVAGWPADGGHGND